MEAVILAGKQVAMETQWPPDTPERAAMDSLRAQYSALEERWKVLSQEAEEWGQLLEKVLPEMEKFQVHTIHTLTHTHPHTHTHTLTHTTRMHARLSGYMKMCGIDR